MATTYPESIDTVITLPTALDNTTPIRAAVVNALRDAIIEIEAELGVQPAGVYGTVRNRLDILEFAITGNTNLGGTFFSGDLTGNFSGQEVIGFYGRPLVEGVPLVGQVYSWDGYQWALTQPGAGNLPPVSNMQYAALIENPAGNPVFQRLTEDMILPGFAITGFSISASPSTLVETGETVISPVSFTMSYNETVTAATLSNSDGFSAVFNAPYTSGSINHAFQHMSPTTVTFTLSVTLPIPKSAYQYITWENRSFGGVGAAGASASVTASGDNAVLSTSDVIDSIGLHSSDTGQVYGPFSPVNQKIYLLLVGGSHTFKDQNGFTFPFNTPTPVSFVNQWGATISMYLYESTNLNDATFTITVSS